MYEQKNLQENGSKDRPMRQDKVLYGKNIVLSGGIAVAIVSEFQRRRHDMVSDDDQNGSKAPLSLLAPQPFPLLIEKVGAIDPQVRASSAKCRAEQRSLVLQAVLASPDRPPMEEPLPDRGQPPGFILLMARLAAFIGMMGSMVHNLEFGEHVDDPR